MTTETENAASAAMVAEGSPATAEVTTGSGDAAGGQNIESTSRTIPTEEAIARVQPVDGELGARTAELRGVGENSAGKLNFADEAGNASDEKPKPVRVSDAEVQRVTATSEPLISPRITVARTVLYTLSAIDADKINRCRGANTTDPSWPNGAVAHVGNYAYAGDVVPLLVVKVWGSEMVNGQAFLDGNDSLWITSAHKAAGDSEPGCWHWPPRV